MGGLLINEPNRAERDLVRAVALFQLANDEATRDLRSPKKSPRGKRNG
jgi:hypothetical protein